MALRGLAAAGMMAAASFAAAIVVSCANSYGGADTVVIPDHDRAADGDVDAPVASTDAGVDGARASDAQSVDGAGCGSCACLFRRRAEELAHAGLPLSERR